MLGLGYSLRFYLVRVLGLVKVKSLQTLTKNLEKVPISTIPNRYNMKKKCFE
jgi:hypothetical protein